MGTNGLNRRVMKLEDLVAVAIPQPEPEPEIDPERRAALQERYERVLSTMSPEHIEEVMPVIEAILDGEDVPRHKGVGVPAHLLLGWVHGSRAHDGDRPLSLCPVVYEALKEGAGMYHDCEDCGCKVPIFCGREEWGPNGRESVPARRVVDKCPLCGGRVGYAYYFHKQIEPKRKQGQQPS